MARSHLFSLVLALVFMSMSVYGFDEDLEDFKLYEDLSASEARTFNFSNSDGLIPDARAVLAFLLLGLLALTTFGPSLLSSFTGGGGNGNSYGNYNRNGYDYDYNYNNQAYAEDQATNQDQFYARSGQEDMVTRMLQLEQIFKKFEVEEDECRAYIACESANVEKLAENGPIVQQTHEFFNSVNYAKPEALAKFYDNKPMMVMKQAYDHAKANQQHYDVCAPLRNACQALRQRKN